MNRSPRQLGVTLLELLAAIVLFSLAASLCARMLRGVHTAHQTAQRTSAALAVYDRWMAERNIAPDEASVIVELDSVRWTVRVSPRLEEASADDGALVWDWVEVIEDELANEPDALPAMRIRSVRWMSPERDQ